MTLTPFRLGRVCLVSVSFHGRLAGRFASENRFGAAVEIGVDGVGRVIDIAPNAVPEIREIWASGLRGALEFVTRRAKPSRTFNGSCTKFGIVEEMLLFDHATQKRRGFNNGDLVV